MTNKRYLTSMGLVFAYCLGICSLLIPADAVAQCCAGGSGSPLAGGTSQGVLDARQIELSANFQFIRSHKFFTGRQQSSDKYFDRFESTYQYFRFAYGASPHFTMSIETGHYLFKREVGLNGDPENTYKSSGLADLILFPRYTVLNRKTLAHTTELTLGLGIKLPIGTYDDSTARKEPFSGQTYHVTNPQAVQMTTGAQDVIFYGFFFRAYPSEVKLFSSMVYVKKGWNPLGERMGDFASLALFAGKSVTKNIGITLQLRAEMMERMQINSDIQMFSFLNYDPEATGYRKIFVSPQLSLNLEQFSLYLLIDVPVYQQVFKTQVGTGFQAMAGFSYRFSACEPALPLIIKP